MSKNARILIVDDDESIRATTQAILEDEGYLVDLASSGTEAIEMSNERIYNLALLDIRLPDMEGVELLKLMKTNVPRTRKVMVTGFPSLQNAVTSVNESADAYLIKPVDVEKLLGVVKEQLRLQEEEQKINEEKVAEFIETRIKEIAV